MSKNLCKDKTTIYCFGKANKILYIVETCRVSMEYVEYIYENVFQTFS